MADADKTTAEADLEPLPDRFVTPTSIAQKNANGGWNKSSLPSPGGTGPGKNIAGDKR